MIRIKELLKERGMSQKDLAHKMGVSVQYINALVKERDAGSVKMYGRIASVLGVTLRDIFD